MALLNPSFEAAGALPGEAQHWTLSAVTSLESIAGFGRGPRACMARTSNAGSCCSGRARRTSPSCWRVLRHRAEGYEDFEEGWANAVYLRELPPAQLGDVRLRWRHRRALRDRGGATCAYLRDWALVPAGAGVFDGEPVEDFEDQWRSNQAYAWTWAARQRDGRAVRRRRAGRRGLRERVDARRPPSEGATMAEADWTYLNDGLDIATVDRGVTAGIARSPQAAGASCTPSTRSRPCDGARGAVREPRRTSRPMAKGGSIRGVVQRGPGGGPTGFSPFLFLCCQGNSVNDSAYLLGSLGRRPASHRAPQGRGHRRAAERRWPGRAAQARRRASRRRPGCICASTSS
jgi:hypothetical protein